jgi:hypothetical protein
VPDGVVQYIAKRALYAKADDAAAKDLMSVGHGILGTRVRVRTSLLREAGKHS